MPPKEEQTRPRYTQAPGITMPKSVPQYHTAVSKTRKKKKGGKKQSVAATNIVDDDLSFAQTNKSEVPVSTLPTILDNDAELKENKYLETNPGHRQGQSALELQGKSVDAQSSSGTKFINPEEEVTVLSNLVRKIDARLSKGIMKGGFQVPSLARAGGSVTFQEPQAGPEGEVKLQPQARDASSTGPSTHSNSQAPSLLATKELPFQHKTATMATNGRKEEGDPSTKLYQQFPKTQEMAKKSPRQRYMELQYCCGTVYYTNTPEYNEHLAETKKTAHDYRFDNIIEASCCGVIYHTLRLMRAHVRKVHSRDQAHMTQEIAMYRALMRDILEPPFTSDDVDELVYDIDCCKITFSKVDKLEAHIDNVHEVPDWALRDEKVAALGQAREEFEAHLVHVTESLPAEEKPSTSTYRMVCDNLVESMNDDIAEFNEQRTLSERQQFQRQLVLDVVADEQRAGLGPPVQEDADGSASAESVTIEAEAGIRQAQPGRPDTSMRNRADSARGPRQDAIHAGPAAQGMSANIGTFSSHAGNAPHGDRVESSETVTNGNKKNRSRDRRTGPGSHRRSSTIKAARPMKSSECRDSVQGQRSFDLCDDTGFQRVQTGRSTEEVDEAFSYQLPEALRNPMSSNTIGSPSSGKGKGKGKMPQYLTNSREMYVQCPAQGILAYGSLEPCLIADSMQVRRTEQAGLLDNEQQQRTGPAHGHGISTGSPQKKKGKGEARGRSLKRSDSIVTTIHHGPDTTKYLEERDPDASQQQMSHANPASSLAPREQRLFDPRDPLPPKASTHAFAPAAMHRASQSAPELPADVQSSVPWTGFSAEAQEFVMPSQPPPPSFNDAFGSGSAFVGKRGKSKKGRGGRGGARGGKFQQDIREVVDDNASLASIETNPSEIQGTMAARLAEQGKSSKSLDEQTALEGLISLRLGQESKEKGRD